MANIYDIEYVIVSISFSVNFHVRYGRNISVYDCGMLSRAPGGCHLVCGLSEIRNILDPEHFWPHGIQIRITDRNLGKVGF